MTTSSRVPRVNRHRTAPARLSRLTSHTRAPTSYLSPGEGFAWVASANANVDAHSPRGRPERESPAR